MTPSSGRQSRSGTVRSTLRERLAGPPVSRIPSRHLRGFMNLKVLRKAGAASSSERSFEFIAERGVNFRRNRRARRQCASQVTMAISRRSMHGIPSTAWSRVRSPMRTWRLAIDQPHSASWPTSNRQPVLDSSGTPAMSESQIIQPRMTCSTMSIAKRGGSCRVDH
jgi:hypothetical protein